MKGLIKNHNNIEIRIPEALKTISQKLAERELVMVA
jgi:hypothetical protein